MFLSTTTITTIFSTFFERRRLSFCFWHFEVDICDISSAIGLSDESWVKCEWCRWFWQSRELHSSQPTLVECFPESLWAFCEAQNVSLRSRLYLRCTQSPIEMLFSGLDTCYVHRVWLERGVSRSVLLGLRMVSAFPKSLFSPTVDCCSSLFFCATHFFSHLLFFHSTNEKKGAHVTDISKLRSLSISPQQALWSSAVPERRPGLAVCTGLNQSGSLWAQVHLSQMRICRTQLWGQRRFYMHLVQNNMSRHAKLILPGFFVEGPGKDVTHRGGQSVPLRLHHEAVSHSCG